MAKETAEQKLLRLIESAETQDSAQPSSPEAAPDASASGEAQRVYDSVKGVGVSSLAVPGFIGPVLAALQAPLAIIRNPSSIGLKEVNQILILFIIVFGLVFFRTFQSGMEESNSEVRFDDTIAVDNRGESPYPEIKPAEDYAMVVERRNIFQPYERKVAVVETAAEAAEAAPAPSPNQRITDKTNDLRLVGISWLDSYDSVTVMIEDAKTSITHFLKKGDSIKGVQVDEIFADRVILTFDNEKLSLKL